MPKHGKGANLMRKIIIRNRIKCNHCKDIIESTYQHDFKWCKCGKVVIDGGKDYLRSVVTLKILQNYLDMKIKKKKLIKIADFLYIKKYNLTTLIISHNMI